MIKYPDEFVQKAKRVYPSWDHLHDLIHRGSASIGHMLLEAREYHISIAAVLAATSLEELQTKAMRMKEGQELALEWHKIVEEHRANQRRKILEEIEKSHKER